MKLYAEINKNNFNLCLGSLKKKILHLYASLSTSMTNSSRSLRFMKLLYSSCDSEIQGREVNPDMKNRSGENHPTEIAVHPMEQ